MDYETAPETLWDNFRAVIERAINHDNPDLAYAMLVTFHSMAGLYGFDADEVEEFVELENILCEWGDEEPPAEGV